MGYFDKDMEDMLDIYLLETGQLMEQAEGILIHAEKSGQFSPEDINEIFRIMHTTKSSSAMMGLSELSSLTHKVEDLFSEFREDPGRIKCCVQEAFELLFEVTDLIRSELRLMGEDHYIPRTTERQRYKIDALLSMIKGQKSCTVRLKFEQNCKMENIRAFMAARQVKNMCSELSMYPDDVEKNSDTIEYIRKNGFFISFVSAEPERVLERLRGAIFVEQCDMVDGLPELGTSQEKAEETERPVQLLEESYINVRVEKLDQLQNLTGELLVAVSDLMDGESRQKNTLEDDVTHRAGRILKELGELTISMRMVPLKGVISQINRLVRDMCKKEKKEVTFSVMGQDVEVDKKIMDGILEPLSHLIRNAVDHGIELPEERERAGKPRAGKIELKIENTGGEILIHLVDDGSGMDIDKIRDKARSRNLFIKPEEEYTREELLELCMLPGFSTRDTASEYSGRGVGLDVVCQMVERFGGHVDLKSEQGNGTAVHLHLPLTLTIINCILLQSGGFRFAVPSYQVLQFAPYSRITQKFYRQGDREYWLNEGRAVQVLSLTRFYQPSNQQKEEGGIMIHVRSATKEACLVAEQVLEQKSLVEKALPKIFGPHFKYYTGISGCSTPGDGSICMMLDIEDLIRSAERGGRL
ncbi:chemotaxis protein CheA [Clostridium sp. AM58-1XD]|uniref:chemotaxis protein CheA n=1 Tax=Clostridium sp. AM58-1XD TaxID=2292307 RepID=UPI000E54725A|nr:chemotaxis protein CheA [Clostridium sp. AM58-1XD]RGY96837.1 chemotaxis protein CheA [Clostridium sp. AM58-1XD]